jgi:SAM-dependent methyltransferase
VLRFGSSVTDPTVPIDPDDPDEHQMNAPRRHVDGRQTGRIDDTLPSLPPWFFARSDSRPDAEFYAMDRFVTHIDAGAIAAVGALYRELGLDGDVLDLCSSWVSHFDPPPAYLVALGMNEAELAANPAAAEWLVQDLNVEPTLPFADRSFDAVTCCVSIDYLVRPVEVLAEAARVLRPGGHVVITFSNRCFPTKAIRGWLATDDRGRCAIVDLYVRAAGGFDTPTVQHRNPDVLGDPLYAVWARRAPG